MIVGASCTAELLQDDPGGLAKRVGFADPGHSRLNLPAYQKKENWGASETFYRLVRSLAGTRNRGRGFQVRSADAAIILGPTVARLPSPRRFARDIRALIERLGVGHLRHSANGRHALEDLTRLGEADFNVVLYPEIALACRAMVGEERTSQPLHPNSVPIGVERDTAPSLQGSGRSSPASSIPLRSALMTESSRSWLVFALRRLDLFDRQAGLHLSAMRPTQSRRRGSRGFELGLQGRLGLGTYSREFARELRARNRRGLSGPKRLSPTTTWKSKRRITANCEPELMCSARRWSVTSPSGLEFPALSSPSPTHVQDFPGPILSADGFRRARMCCSTPGFIR